MIKYIVKWILVGLVFSTIIIAQGEGGISDSTFFVKFQDNVTEEQARQIIEETGLIPFKKYIVLNNTWLVKVPVNKDRSSAFIFQYISDVTTYPEVEYAIPNVLVRQIDFSDPNDLLYEDGYQSHLYSVNDPNQHGRAVGEDIKFQEAWTFLQNAIDAGTINLPQNDNDYPVIAFFDNDFRDFEHLDFEDSWWVNPAPDTYNEQAYLYGWNCSSDIGHGIMVPDDMGPSTTKHGTRVASVAIAKTNNEIDLAAISMYGKGMMVISPEIPDGLEYVPVSYFMAGWDFIAEMKNRYENDPLTGSNIVAVNCSWGLYLENIDYSPDVLFNSVIENLGLLYGILTVAAVPNADILGQSSVDLDNTVILNNFWDFSQIRKISGGASEYLITVTGTALDGELHPDQPYGQTLVDIAAPCTNIPTLIVENNISTVHLWMECFDCSPGNSLAAPQVSATIAYSYFMGSDDLFQYTTQPGLTARIIKEAVCAFGTPKASLVGKTVYGTRLNENSTGIYVYSFLDSDADGIHNDVDNCPEMYNPDQTDNNGNGVGDICEDDGGGGDDPPIYTIRFTNIFDLTQSYYNIGGQLILNGSDTLESGYPVNFSDNNEQIVKTKDQRKMFSETIIYQHRRWNNADNEYRLEHTFTPDQGNQWAKFKRIHPVYLTSNLNVDLEINDPWYYDQDMNDQPNNFYIYSDVDNPDGSYEVFLDQGDPSNPASTDPYYSLRRPDEITVTETDIIAFSGWEVYNSSNQLDPTAANIVADPQYPDDPTIKAVVFKKPGAKVLAKFEAVNQIPDYTLSINNGEILTITTPSNISFSEGFSFNVANTGKLEIQGTEAQPIIFTGSGKDPNWTYDYEYDEYDYFSGGLITVNAGESIEPYNPNLTISNAIFKEAKNPIVLMDDYPAGLNSHERAIIENVEIEDVNVGMVLSVTGKVSI